jgi:hypothetical protein
MRTGDSVPQNGQTSLLFAGFHTPSPPHAGHVNFCRASIDASPGAADVPVTN